MKKKKVAIIGTNGIPAKYGGFETLAENIVRELNDKFSFIVYCSKTPKKEKLTSYYGARLVYLPLSANGWQSIIYDIISTFHAWFIANSLLILGPAGGFILPLNVVFRRRIIVNHGGLNEWEREKYNLFERKLIWINHNFAAKFSKYNIADNLILNESIYSNFKRRSIIISYGGDHVKPVKPNSELLDKYSFLSKKYIVSVSRAQIDNNIHILLEAYSKLTIYTLVIVSNWSVSEYGIRLYEKYSTSNSNIVLLNAIYDQEELNCIRSNAVAYIHSHSRCGTSPSLVEAISLNLPIISLDMPTNRETMHGKALFFKNAVELENILVSLNNNTLNYLRCEMEKLKKEYRWKIIAGKYAELF